MRYGRVAVDMLRMERIRRRVLKDPQRYAYTDQALRDVAADNSETLELLNHNAAARMKSRARAGWPRTRSPRRAARGKPSARDDDVVPTLTRL